MRKPDFCLCENKDTDQLCSNCTADQRLCFRYTVSTISSTSIQNFKLLACFSDCTGWFVSDLVGNSNCWFSHTVAQMIKDHSHNSALALSSVTIVPTSYPHKNSPKGCSTTVLNYFLQSIIQLLVQ